MTAKIVLDEKDFKNILDSMVDGVITINKKGVVLSFNTTAEKMFGYARDEVVGENVSILMPSHVGKNHDSFINNYVEKGDAHIIGIGRDVTALKKNGDTFSMRLSVIEYPAKIEGDRWFIGSCKDITLQKQQEEQLRRSIKMEAVGKLTSGIAHDYNNMLGVILGFSELIEEKAEGQEKLLEYIEYVKNAANRGANLTKQLLSITRKRTETAESFKINKVLEKNKELLLGVLTSRISLSINCDEDLWDVFLDKGSFEDAILNLSINAMHAMPEAGDLNITAANTKISFIESQVLNVKPGEYVKLMVTDTGIGMTDETVSHIFDPFFTTKGEKGTGLGLSQVLNFIHQAKGSIRVYSELGHGTCFSIYFPRYIKPSIIDGGDQLNQSHHRNLTGAGEKILIVDDEDEIRKMSNLILTSNGYKTFTASNAEEALIILESEKVDLLLTDVIMPGLDGFELAHIVMNKYPDIKLQLNSGFSEPKGKSVTNETLSKNILEKPFTSEDLLLKIKALLNGVNTDN